MYGCLAQKGDVARADIKSFANAKVRDDLQTPRLGRLMTDLGDSELPLNSDRHAHFPGK